LTPEEIAETREALKPKPKKKRAAKTKAAPKKEATA